jgi:hypothetical protein
VVAGFQICGLLQAYCTAVYGACLMPDAAVFFARHTCMHVQVDVRVAPKLHAMRCTTLMIDSGQCSKLPSGQHPSLKVGSFV